MRNAIAWSMNIAWRIAASCEAAEAILDLYAYVAPPVCVKLACKDASASGRTSDIEM